MVSSSLLSQVVAAAPWHINADEIVNFNYSEANLANNLPKPASFYNADPFRTSDHDPLIIELNLQKPVKRGDLDQNGVVDSRDITVFQQLLRQPALLGAEYDFNGDGVVNQLDVRSMMLLCDLPRCAIPQ